MNDPLLKTVVVGAGAIGGVTAAFLALAGWDPELVCRHQETLDVATGPGLHVFGVRGDRRVRLRAVRRVAELSQLPDIVLLATKATDMLGAAKALKPLLRPGCLVVSLQNGICEEALAAVLGRETVLGCVVGWGATMHAPGELEVSSNGEFVLGSLNGQHHPWLPLAREMLSSVVPTRVSSNIMGELYSKLIINSCITALGGVCGLYLGEMLGQRRVRSLFMAIMREAMAVAAAMGLQVEPGGGGKLDYQRFLAGTGWTDELRRHLTIRLIGFKYRRIKSSLLQSLQRARPTEIDYLNGYICHKGRELGVPTPVNQAVVEVIKKIEAGLLPVARQNLAALPLVDRIGLAVPPDPRYA